MKINTDLSIHSIVFVDNSINQIFKTINHLKTKYENTDVFVQEKLFLEFFEKNSADIIFINLDLKPNDALFILKDIKQINKEPNPYVVIYTENNDDFVQELAFNSGADFFINFHQKPLVMELFIKNILKRKVNTKTDTKKRIYIDFESYLIFNQGKPFQLPRKEFMLFELLYNNSDKYFSKVDLAKIIWADESIALKRTIDVHVYNIRQFFGKNIILSKKGIGYSLNKKLIEF